MTRAHSEMRADSERRAVSERRAGAERRDDAGRWRPLRRSRTAGAALALLLTSALMAGGAMPALAADDDAATPSTPTQTSQASPTPASAEQAGLQFELREHAPAAAPAATPPAQGIDAVIRLDLDEISVWALGREGLTLSGWDFAPNATITIAIDGETVGQVSATADGEVGFTFTVTAAPGTYTMTLTAGADRASTTFRVLADADFYSPEWIASFDPGISVSRDVVSLAELAATPIDIEGWDFPESFSATGPSSVDLLVDGTAVETLFTNSLGNVEAQLTGPLAVGTRQVTLTSPVGTASVSLVVVPNEQGTKPRAGSYEGTTLQTHAGSSAMDDPAERPFRFAVDASGRLTGLNGEFWWFCRGGHGSGFDDWSTTEFPATPITVDRPFEIHWSDISMDYIITGIVRGDGSASGTLYALHGACGTNIQTWSTQLAGTTPPPPTGLPAPQRVSGDDRYATSVDISQRSFPGKAPVVYLASGTSFPDGLAAGPAAAAQGGPVLLTPQGAATQSVLDEIARLDPARVVIVGGTPSVSANVAQQVRALPGSPAITRLGGGDRYETSRLIAAHAFPTGAPAAFVATGLKFPDALTAGPAAALRGGPVLLVRGSGSSLDAATRTALRELGADWVGIAGDTSSISAGIASGIDAVVTDVQRFAGADRYHTAALIGALFPSADSVLVASGLGFADALPGAAAAGAEDAPMLLARTACMPDASIAALQRLQPDAVVLLGGTPTLGAAVAAYTRC